MPTKRQLSIDINNKLNSKAKEARISSIKRKLPTRNEYHWFRKLWHLFGGIALSTFVWNTPPAVLFPSIGILVVGFCISEFGRRWSSKLNTLYVHSVGLLLREHEVKQFSGSFYFIIGSSLSIFFFHRVVSTLSILYLAVGDPIASAVGLSCRNMNHFRLPEPSGKSLLGTMAAILACFLISFSLLSSSCEDSFCSFESTQIALVIISGCGAVIGGFSELLSPYPVPLDDNLLIPVFSSIGLTLIFRLCAVDQNMFQFPLLIPFKHLQ